jgi:hypothetical protein
MDAHYYHVDVNWQVELRNIYLQMQCLIDKFQLPGKE